MSGRRSPLQERIDVLIGKEKPFRWASKVGVPKSGFSRIWGEPGSIPQQKTYDRIVEATGCSRDWLVYGIGLPFPGEKHAANERSTAEDVQAVQALLAEGNKRAGEDEPGNGPGEVDVQRLAIIVEFLERWLVENRSGEAINPKRKAQAIALMYRYLKTVAQISSEDVEQFARLMA